VENVKPIRMTHKAIQDLAQQVGDEFAIYDEHGCADLDRLLRTLGGKTRQALENESLTIRASDDFTVSLPSFTSQRRDRFTIAHELGHYFLHYLPRAEDEEAPTLFHRGEQDPVETQANVFASALLMPETQFRAAWHKWPDPDRLALVFDVSPAAARVRAQVLSLEADA